MARVPLDQAISEIYEYLIKSKLLENGDHVITTGIDGSEISHREEDVEDGGSGGDTYTGYFAPSNTSDDVDQKITIADGVVVVGGQQIDIAEEELTLTEITTETIFIYIEVTYNSDFGTYEATLEFADLYPLPISGTWRKVITTCDWDLATPKLTNIQRQQAGPVHYGG